MKRFAYWAMLAAMAGLFAVAAGCMSTTEGERSVRAKDYDPGVMTREGLAARA